MIDKEFELLRKRIEDLEKRINEPSQLLFGRSYSKTGSLNSDFLIRTKGQVKIQFGSKFIDLIKDGKVNADAKFIFKEESVGIKDGIYIIGEGEETLVILSIGGTLVNLKGEVGTTYVSFQAKLNTTSEEKYIALKNIGFIYKSLEDVSLDGLKNGIIYIESELRLYLVKDGVLSEFKVTIPNPFTLQFVILKNDDSKGALVIKGDGSTNSIAFDSFLIYTELNNCIIDSTNSVIVKTGNSDKVIIDSSSVIIDADLITNMIKSPSTISDSGFKLYCINGKSVLEIDKVIERDSQYDLKFPILTYPEFWLLNSEMIKKATSRDSTELEETNEPTNILNITLFHKCTYKVGDILCTYQQKDIEEDTGQIDAEGLPTTNTTSSYTRIELEVIGIGTNGKEMQVKCSDTLDEDTINNFAGKLIFLIKPFDNKLPIRIKSNNIDLVEYGDKSENSRNESIMTRIGDLAEVLGEEGFGIYTNHLLLGGTEEKNFPKYTETLNSIISALNIKDSNNYNCVLVSVGMLKKVLKNNLEIIDELKQKIEIMKTDIDKIKQQLE